MRKRLPEELASVRAEIARLSLFLAQCERGTDPRLNQRLVGVTRARVHEMLTGARELEERIADMGAEFDWLYT